MNRTLFVLCCLSSWLVPGVSLPAQTRPLPAAVRSIALQLKDYKGGPVQDATVLLVGVQPGKFPYRHVPDQEPRALTAADFDGPTARLADLPDGEFVVMVDHPMFARSLSEPFKLPSRKEAVIAVTLARGGVLEGRVLGPDQQPLAGAVVRTQNATLANTGPMWSMLETVVVDPLGTGSTTTAADGAFRLERVAHGTHRVVVEHPDFVPVDFEVEVTKDETKQLRPVQLADGVLIRGRVLRGSKPVPGAEVTFLFEEIPTDARNVEPGRFRSYKARADANGDFRLPCRVPPGKGYVLMAAEAGAPRAQALQSAASRTKFDVKAGKAEHVELLKLPEQ